MSVFHPTQHFTHLDDEHRSGVLELIAAATDHDGFPPIAEHVLLHLRHGGDKADSHIITCDGPRVIGYAHLDATDEVEGPSVEIVIHPDFRNHGYGGAILSKAQEVCGARMRLWAHGDSENSKSLATRSGFERIRTVIQMKRSLVEALPIQESVANIRTFLPTLDNQEWVTLNNNIFAKHPDQSGWTLKDLGSRTSESWFDPGGFFIAVDNETMIGFCWTKIHGGHSHTHSGDGKHHDHDPIGEIYIMGVSSSHAGKGLGKSLVIAGLRYMRQNGILNAMLYVDSDNSAALHLYKSLGFVESGRDVLYRLSAH
ncbi:MAG: mycothiol synthase [Actinomycetes bacterium]